MLFYYQPNIIKVLQKPWANIISFTLGINITLHRITISNHGILGFYQTLGVLLFKISNGIKMFVSIKFIWRKTVVNLTRGEGS